MRVVIALIVMVLALDAGMASVFARRIAKKHSDTVIRKVDRNIVSSSTHLNALITKAKLTRLAPVDKLGVVAEAIAGKSAFAKQMMETTDPLDMVRYYAKHGDAFLDTTQMFSSAVPAVLRRTPNLDALKGRFPTLTLTRYTTAKEVSGRFIEVLKLTGKKGWQLSKNLTTYAMKHNKSMAAGIALAWFLSDPNGFHEAMRKSGETLGDFVHALSEPLGHATVKLAAGLGSGIADGFKDVLSANVLIGLLAAGALFALWLFKGIIFRKVKLTVRRKENDLDDQLSSRNRSRL